MKKHIIIFGGSSFLAQEVFKNFKKKKLISQVSQEKKKSTIIKLIIV